MLKCESISGNHYKCRPLFVDDKSLLFVAAGSAVHVASLVTGELLCALKAYSGNVTSIVLHPTLPDVVSIISCHMLLLHSLIHSFTLIIFLNFITLLFIRLLTHSLTYSLCVSHVLQILTSTVNGSIVAWNFETQEELKRCNVDIAVQEIVTSKLLGVGEGDSETPNVIPTELFLVVGPFMSSKMIIFNTETMKTRKHILDMKKSSNCSALFPYSYGRSDENSGDEGSSAVDYLIVGSKKKLVLWGVGASIERDAPNERIQASVTQCSAAITAVACNSHKDMIVTGHENGEMLIWHNVRKWIGESSSASAGQRSTKVGTRMTPPACTALHWHAQVVTALQFSIDGSLLYSGGKEGVLVIWQTMSPGSKSFVPRLGGSISYLSASTQEAKVAVTSTDNCLRVIHAASMRDEWCVRSACMGVGGLSIVDEDTSPSGGKAAKIQIACNSMTNQIACNGYPGQLQLLDVTSAHSGVDGGDPTVTDLAGSSSMRLPVNQTHQIVSYNRISKMDNAVTARGKTNLQGKLFAPSVTLFKYHSYRYALPTSHTKGKNTSFLHSHFMATVDVCRGEECDAESSLKIWKWMETSTSGRESAKYKLVAQIDRPHNSSRVNSMVFFNCNNSSTDSELAPIAGLATCGVDGSVKVWHCMIQPQGREKQQAQKKHTNKASLMMSIIDNAQWSCAYSFTYRACRAGGLSVSMDDSVLAVGHGSLLALWDPSTVELKGKVSLSCMTVGGLDTDLTDDSKREAYEISANNNIVFSSFIEPKNSASMGSGSGEAYLVAATSVAVFVVDLLSLSVLWKVGGEFDGQLIRSVTACGNNDQVMRRLPGNEKDQLCSGTSDEGWFAVCMTKAEKDTEGDSKPRSSSELLVFSPTSKDPLYSTSISTVATSMVFWTTPGDHTHGPKNVLLATTQSREMIMFSTPGDNERDEPMVLTDTTNAVSYATKMTGRRDLPILSELKAEEVSAADRAALPTSEKAKSFLNSSSSFFSETSSKMPSVSVLFDGYMRNALSKKRKLSEATTDGKKSGQQNKSSSNIENDNNSNNKFKRNKKNNFSDPQYRQKVQSQLFAAFSKPKGNVGSKNTAKSVNGKTKKSNGDTASGDNKEKIPRTPKKQKTQNVATPTAPTPTVVVDEQAAKSKSKTPKSTKKSASSGEAQSAKKMRSPKLRAAKKV